MSGAALYTELLPSGALALCVALSIKYLIYTFPLLEKVLKIGGRGGGWWRLCNF